MAGFDESTPQQSVVFESMRQGEDGVDVQLGHGGFGSESLSQVFEGCELHGSLGRPGLEASLGIEEVLQGTDIHVSLYSVDECG